MLKRMLREINEKTQTTLVISSHDLPHVTDICRRVAILERGKIIKDPQTMPETLKELESYFAV